MGTSVKTGERRVLYLYGVTQSEPAQPPRMAGVDLESPVEGIDCQGVICWVSRVSAVQFEAELSRNMENLDWLATASVAHQRAIAAIAQEADILPARFGTVFRDQQSLEAHIRGHVSQMKNDFKRIHGAEEWGIKVFAAAPVPATIPKARTGKEYLQAKAALLPRKSSERIPASELAEFQEALSGIVEESAPAGRISSGQRGLLHQTSVLVKRGKRARLQSVLKKFSRKWAESRRIECSGPWPPYSFVSQDSESA